MPVSCFHLPNIKYVKIARCWKAIYTFHGMGISIDIGHGFLLLRFDLHQAIPEADLLTVFVWSTFAQNYPNYAPKKGPWKERKDFRLPNVSMFSLFFVFHLVFTEFFCLNHFKCKLPLFEPLLFLTIFFCRKIITGLFRSLLTSTAPLRSTWKRTWKPNGCTMASVEVWRCLAGKANVECLASHPPLCHHHFLVEK